MSTYAGGNLFYSYGYVSEKASCVLVLKILYRERMKMCQKGKHGPVLEIEAQAGVIYPSATLDIIEEILCLGETCDRIIDETGKCVITDDEPTVWKDCNAMWKGGFL